MKITFEGSTPKELKNEIMSYVNEFYDFNPNQMTLPVCETKESSEKIKKSKKEKVTPTPAVAGSISEAEPVVEVKPVEETREEAPSFPKPEISNPPTKTDVTKVLQYLNFYKSITPVRGLLEKYGVPKVGDLPEDKYSKFIAEAFELAK